MVLPLALGLVVVGRTLANALVEVFPFARCDVQSCVGLSIFRKGLVVVVGSYPLISQLVHLVTREATPVMNLKGRGGVLKRCTIIFFVSRGCTGQTR
jgi:hypothetical protein